MFAWLQAGWGDDARDPLEAPLNPHFSQEALSQYSSSTQRNIARLDEDRIDFDLLEELVTYIDQEYGDGAILVFLPGMSPPSTLTIDLHTKEHNWLTLFRYACHARLGELLGSAVSSMSQDKWTACDYTIQITKHNLDARLLLWRYLKLRSSTLSSFSCL